MTSRDAIPFLKMNGLGNEIVIIDLRGSARVLSADEARAIAARPDSYFDQLMVLHDPRSQDTDAFVRIYNRDGSLAQACGNGTRCIGWAVAQQTGRNQLRFETAGGLLDVHVESIDRITVDMGEPRFRWDEIPLSEPFEDTRRIELKLEFGGQPKLQWPSVVNVGNPHAVFWVEDVDAYYLARLGPQLEAHPIFPERANISLAQVTSPSALKLRTWERGAGLTRACGSAACAAAVLAARTGRTGRIVTVTLPGGMLHIEWTEANRILMRGPVELEHEGTLDWDALSRSPA